MVLEELVVKVLGDVNHLKGALDRARGFTKSWGDRIKGIIAGASKAAMIGGIGILVAGLGTLVAVTKDAIPLTIEFQSSLTDLSIAASDSGMSMKELHDSALLVGGDTRLLGVSASGAAASMTGLYKAGLTTTEIFGDLQGYMEGTAELGGALRAAIDLAAASELDMVQASDLAAVTLATFGGALETAEERAEFVNRALDNMIRAADASVAEVSDLADALVAIGPIASAMGMSIEETNNALAILSTRGITGASAGTALKSMITNMRRPTDEVQSALASLNVELYNAEGNFRGLPAILGDLEVGLSGTTQEMRDYYVTTLAGSYGMVALNTLLSEGTEGWNAMSEATANATGIAEQAERKSQTLAGRIEALQGAFETIKIRIGEALLPAMTSLVDILAAMTDKYAPYLAAVLDTVVTPALTDAAYFVEAFLAVLMDTGDPLRAAETALNETFGTTLQFADAIWDLIMPLISLTRYLWSTATTGDALNDWLTHLSPELRPLASLLGKVATGFRRMVSYVADNWPMLLRLAAAIGVVVGVGAGIISVLSGVGGVVLSVGGTIGSAIVSIVATIAGVVTAVTAIAGGISAAVAAVGGIGPAIAAIIIVVIAALPAFIAWIGMVIAAMATWAVAIAAGMTLAIPVVIGFVQQVIARWGEIQAGIESAIAQLTPIVQDFISTISGWVRTKWALIRPYVAMVWNFLISQGREVANWLINNFLGTVRQIVDWIVENYPAIKTAVIGTLDRIFFFVVTKVIPALVDFFHWLGPKIEAAINLARRVWETILKPTLAAIAVFILGTVVPAVSEFVTWLMTKIGEGMTTVKSFWDNTLKPTLKAIWSFINDDLLPMFAAWEDVLRAIAEKAFTALQGAWQNILKPMLDDLWGVIERNVLPVLEDLWTIFDRVATLVRDTVAPILDTLKTATIDLLSRAMEGLRAIIDGITTRLEGLAEAIRGITLPSWLTPGSATPFEVGLRGIADALNQVDRAMGRNVSQFSQLHAASAGPPMGDASGRETHFHIQAQYDYQPEVALRDDIRLLQMSYT